MLLLFSLSAVINASSIL